VINFTTEETALGTNCKWVDAARRLSHYDTLCKWVDAARRLSHYGTHCKWVDAARRLSHYDTHCKWVDAARRLSHYGTNKKCMTLQEIDIRLSSEYSDHNGKFIPWKLSTILRTLILIRQCFESHINT
jgi:glycerol-3-phosphate cytidylyltransferase-like family protein